MNRVQVDQIVNAVLYEGYILYPYKSSIKNCHSLTFGRVYPHECCDVHDPSSRSSLHIECLIEPSDHAQLDLEIRFLHITDRKIARATVAGTPIPTSITEGDLAWEFLESAEVGGVCYHRWQEAVERRVDCEELSLESLVNEPEIMTFAFPAKQEIEAIPMDANLPPVVLVREQMEIRGLLMAYVEEIQPGLRKLILQISNDSKVPNSTMSSRRVPAQQCSFASTNAVLEVRGSRFVSLTDAPAEYQLAAAACRNDGAWPVLLGEIEDPWGILASPIVLPDFPEVSVTELGDCYHGTESE